MSLRLAETPGDIQQLVSAVAVPMLVVDYTDLIERHLGASLDEIAARLEDEAEFMTCLSLPRQLGVSEEWVRLYGLPYDHEAPDLVERRFSSELYPDLREHLIEQFLAPFRGVSSIYVEHVAPALAGDVTVRSHWKASMTDGTPDYTRIVIVDLDISDLRQVESALEEAIESKDRLMATLAHELRNPLTGVVGFSSILDSEWDSLDDATRRAMVEDIARQVGDVSSLLDDFLTFNVNDTLRVEDTDLDLSDILDGIELAGVDVDADPTLSVRGDAVRIRQILRNLIRNADRHGGTAKVLRARAGGGQVVIGLIDDGPGVAPDVLERLFQPFSHGTTAGSLGLGLAVSRKLARAMGGDLRYQRSQGLTSFELVLRAAPAEA